MQIVVSAPGKIFLLGDHVVVYDKPALLAAIDRRLCVRVRRIVQCHPDPPMLHRGEGSRPLLKSSRDSSASSLRMTSSCIEFIGNSEVMINTSENDYLVKHAISVFKKAFSIEKLPPLKITVDSQIPTGCGLGSSAALAAATIGALMKLVKDIWNPSHINELAFEVEKIAHGNPSGADNTTVVFGGLVWYRREFDFLKSIWSLPISDYKMPHFLLLDTGRPKETTREMVESVARMYKKKKKVVEVVLNDQEYQTKKLLLALRKGDKKEIIEAIKIGEYNLEKIGVVGSFAKKIIREIEELGGAAKICGAGGKREGSGILLCHHENLSKIKNVAKRYSLPVFPVKLGEEGIRIENQES